MFVSAIRRISWLIVVCGVAIFVAVSPPEVQLGIQARAPARADYVLFLVPFQLACIGLLVLFRVGPFERQVMSRTLGMAGFWVATVLVIAFWVVVYEDLFLGLLEGRLATLVLWKGTPY